jgi:hypothetical protein
VNSVITVASAAGDSSDAADALQRAAGQQP